MLSLGDNHKIIFLVFYVDNLLTGAENKEEIQRIKREIIQILVVGDLTLQKCSSNDNSLLADSIWDNAAPFR